MAIAELDDKPLRGKKLVVTLANDVRSICCPHERCAELSSGSYYAAAGTTDRQAG